MDKIEHLACLYIAFLRAITLIHKNNHWLSKGKNFYGQHLLFDRLYEDAAKNEDAASEKIIGVFGDEAFDLPMQVEMLHKIMKKFISGNPTEISLKVVQEFLKLSQTFYDLLKKENRMTLGVDDLIMEIASKNEEAVYLLQQVLKEPKSAARKNLLKRLANK